MSSQKLEAVKDYLRAVNRDLNIANFSEFLSLVNLSEEWKELEHKTRSFYDQYLDLDKETLSWIMFLDATVLLYFIKTYVDRQAQNQLYPELENLVPDVFKLENQIPIIYALELRKYFNVINDVDADIELFAELATFCRDYSPLQCTTVDERRNDAFDKNNHMLHFMYQMIIKNRCTGCWQEPPELNPERCRDRVGMIAKVAADHLGELVHLAVDEFNSALAQAENAGLKVPGNIQKVSQLLQKFESIFRLQRSNQIFPDDKIEIPSVSRLTEILNIKFKRLPNDHGIGDILFTHARGRKCKIYLPCINMRSSTDFILRNLVAYEATLSKQQRQLLGSTLLRDYVDLMCGLIKSDKDVQLLMDADIIDTNLPYQEITNMCQRIKKSDEMPDTESAVHMTVEGANEQFKNSRCVKSWRGFMKFYAFIVKNFRAFFPFLIFRFLGFQSVCEIFDCRVRPNGGGAAAMRNLYFGDSFELDPQDKLTLPRKMIPY